VFCEWRSGDPDAGDALGGVRIGEKGADPIEMYLNDIFTVTVNMAGLPASAFPPARIARFAARPAVDRPPVRRGDAVLAREVIEQAAGRFTAAEMVVMMTDLKASLADSAPGAALSPPLAALWWAAKGNWDAAHKIVMDESGKDAAWVHAYLHRVEGDLGNAAIGTAKPASPWRRIPLRPNGRGLLPRSAEGGQA